MENDQIKTCNIYCLQVDFFIEEKKYFKIPQCEIKMELFRFDKNET